MCKKYYIYISIFIFYNDRKHHIYSVELTLEKTELNLYTCLVNPIFESYIKMFLKMKKLRNKE